MFPDVVRNRLGSVWIRFLSNLEPFASELYRLLTIEEVAGHQLVYGELLVGDRGGRSKLLAAYDLMPQAPLVPHTEVVGFVRDRHLHGRGLGWIDMHLLASAIIDRLQLWTADRRLEILAQEFGVSYQLHRR